MDYAYHVAPITGQHIQEMEQLVTEFGVTSFKIFMFYGGHGLHGRSSDQQSFLMIGEDEKYDLAHFEFIMRALKEVTHQQQEMKDYLSLNLHCETAEIMTAYTKLVEEAGALSGLAAYNAARPQHSEGLAIFIASYLAHETECANINLLHLSSRKAFEAALMMQEVFPHINFRREVTVGHLLLDIDTPTALYAKVNPPSVPEKTWSISGREYWRAKWTGSSAIMPVARPSRKWIQSIRIMFSWPRRVLEGRSTFSRVFSVRGSKRGMSHHQMAQLLCWNPARRFACSQKEISPSDMTPIWSSWIPMNPLSSEPPSPPPPRVIPLLRPATDRPGEKYLFTGRAYLPGRKGSR